MSTATSVPTDALPHAQRLRLIRSTRKVQSILGETPILTEAVSSASGAQGLHRANSSPSATSRGSRPVLFVRLPPASLFTGTISSPHSPTSSVALSSPATPTFGAQEETARRRTIAKLSRTLGENIPPELVFPGTHTATVRRPRRASSLTTFDLNARSSLHRTQVGTDGVLDADETSTNCSPAPSLGGSFEHRSEETGLLRAALTQ
ncbi:hypothetical protein B0H16DRAFT_979765 [Mycena metata]|uniref:Uncharacterized protein n=1 Tax=Mycena metata TaxID=1033252 RepID=A0AAD7IK65_9AGAR|nr:hypothetical protein B0H16DRAFT_979765 [Mycena metata]